MEGAHLLFFSLTLAPVFAPKNWLEPDPPLARAK